MKQLTTSFKTILLKALKRIDLDFIIYIVKVVFGTILASLFMRHVMELVNVTEVPMIPFFACIGVLVGMEPNKTQAISNVINRNVGTIVAGLTGGIVASFTEDIFLISLGLIPYLIFVALLDFKKSIVPGGIFYFAITYLTTLDNAWMYALNRTIGTVLGTLMGLAINFLIFPPKEESQ
ncbi:FUSC family protein [Anaerosphaera multitolerans]|uniref:Integral membrane bound transporter domain-containing protein n=1 Tax=Anaerosphaera multitolerans TaxID=2487351 RepID=A0A437S813_9FIRM|nr:FUSC family protein [Anaerosphaera multitolerans]RVU54977.1 hypothetical protein EF514_05175 [Anaerosphaera multitolerans]